MASQIVVIGEIAKSRHGPHLSVVKGLRLQCVIYSCTLAPQQSCHFKLDAASLLVLMDAAVNLPLLNEHNHIVYATVYTF